MSSIWPAVVSAVGGGAGMTALAKAFASWLDTRTERRKLQVTIRYADGEVTRFRANSVDADALADMLRRSVADGNIVHARMEPADGSLADVHPPTEKEPPAKD